MSTRSGGFGGPDLYVTTRTSTSDPWGAAVNLGPKVNSAYGNSLYGEWNPSISQDGLTLFFSSARPPGSADNLDIWMTRRATREDEWGTPVHLPAPVNSSSQDSSPCISADCLTLYFVSGRPGGVGSDSDFWQVPILPIVDLNGDGIVDSADLCIMVDHWGTDEPLCDIGPMPWGDGIVDVQDLIVLADHLFEDYRLVAHWALDEEMGNTAYDKVSGYDSILIGGPTWQPDGGKVGGSLQFDGVDDYVSTPFILNPAKSSFSVSAWIKGGAPGQVMICQTDVTDGRRTDQGDTWLLADASYGRLMTRLMHPPFPPLVSESVITDDQWHHIGLVYDLDALHRSLYVDGAEVAKDTDFVGGVGSEGGLYIGADKTLDSVSFFSGLIDDIRIHNQALSAEEIAALAN